MAISALNFFWLTAPHDLQGIRPPSCAKLRSQNIITKVTRQCPVLTKQTLDEVFAQVQPFGRGSRKRREKLPK
jgi:hypothetical protein